MKNINIPIACKLSDSEMEDRLVSWTSVRNHMSSLVQLENGMSAKVPAAAAQTIRDLASIDTECCPSMLVELAGSDGELGLKITSEKIDVIRAIHSLFCEGDN
jgi:hypothetical protein